MGHNCFINLLPESKHLSVVGMLLSERLHTEIHKSKRIFLKIKRDLGVAYHIPPLKKTNQQGEMPLPHPITKFYIL